MERSHPRMETKQGGQVMDCILCNEETEEKEFGICLDCQKKVCKGFNILIEYLDEDPYLKIKPQEKEIVYDFVAAISRLASNVEYNWRAIKNHHHADKTVPVVEVDEEASR